MTRGLPFYFPLLLGVVLLLALVAGCAQTQELVDKVNTPENREKAASGLLTAADTSCTAAIQYMSLVGPQLEDPAARIEALKAVCVEAASLQAPVIEEPPSE